MGLVRILRMFENGINLQLAGISKYNEQFRIESARKNVRRKC